MEYGDAEYWDERYKRETEPFEWYQDYNSMQKVLENNINSSSKVLVIGCGNSRTSCLEGVLLCWILFDLVLCMMSACMQMRVSISTVYKRRR